MSLVRRLFPEIDRAFDLKNPFFPLLVIAALNIGVAIAMIVHG
jgi:hypothetical protein